MAVEWDGDKVADAISQAARQGLRDAAEYTRERAVQRTPVMDGVLRNSAKVSQDGLTAAISFNTPYAIKQHEELGYRHKDGEAKYLENTMRAERGMIQQIIVNKIRKALE